MFTHAVLNTLLFLFLWNIQGLSTNIQNYPFFYSIFIYIEIVEEKSILIEILTLFILVSFKTRGTQLRIF